MAVATWYWDGRSDVGMGLLLGLGVKEDSTQHTLTKTNMFAVENSCWFIFFCSWRCWCCSTQLQLQSYRIGLCIIDTLKTGLKGWRVAGLRLPQLQIGIASVCFLANSWPTDFFWRKWHQLMKWKQWNDIIALTEDLPWISEFPVGPIAYHSKSAGSVYDISLAKGDMFLVLFRLTWKPTWILSFSTHIR